MLDWVKAPEFDRWSVRDQLGQGGTALVYLAEDREDGQLRAIKIIRPDLASTDTEPTAVFLREMRIAQALDHPNIVRTDATGVAGDVYFIVMEYCEGGSLADLVRASGPLEPQTAVPLFLEVLDALEYAHRAPVSAGNAADGETPVAGVVHRDIKPPNILLAAGPNDRRIAKVADFGLAKAYETAGFSGLTHTGTAAGTPPYMPREQVLNFKYARPDVDVWATAASLYHTLTAATPRDFARGRNPWMTVCNEPVIPIAARGARVPPALAEIIDQALRDDGDRLAYATAAEFRAALDGVRISL